MIKSEIKSTEASSQTLIPFLSSDLQYVQLAQSSDMPSGVPFLATTENLLFLSRVPVTVHSGPVPSTSVGS